jgi:hypothetical protein
MNAIATVKFGNFSRNSHRHIPKWTMPFLVSYGQKFMKRAGNNNLRLVEDESNVAVETTSDTAYEEEFGTSDMAGDGNLQLTADNYEGEGEE